MGEIRGDSSRADNIAEMQMETQRKKLDIDRAALTLAEKHAKTQKIAATAAVIGAIAAVAAAIAGIANLILLIMARHAS